jgi:transcriptional regulator with XRE-family HTH domain
MKAEEYRQALKKLGLTQEGAAALVGSDPRTGRRWATGERSVPPPMATLVRLLLKRPELVAVVRECAKR